MSFGSYSNISKVYPKIKIYINNRGEIANIEKEENGLWKSDSKLAALFENLPKALKIKNQAIITLIQ